MIDRIITVLLLLLCTAVPPAAAGEAAGADPFPRAAAAYVVIRDGTPIWAHRTATRLPPASLTKIMTALLALELGSPDDVVTISGKAARETGSRIGLRAGDRVRLGDLIAAALIASGNDACHAIADHLAGDEKRFADLMNKRAAQLGLTNTHFANASGLDHPRHYSTAADMAVLARHALADPRFSRLVALQYDDFRSIRYKRHYQLRNRNRLLGRYPGAAGVKTGQTDRAGSCLVALAERDGVRVILVLLNAPKRFAIAVRMLDRAFAELPTPPRSP